MKIRKNGFWANPSDKKQHSGFWAFFWGGRGFCGGFCGKIQCIYFQQGEKQ
ncbi:MAG: hypothetical protein HAW59_06940 [Betaproteobacteria bacterium]|nr:hypothetical protein [Betaproteobacteria bacterium]